MRLREQYAPQLQILIGFESDWIRPSSEAIILSLLKKYQFDLFIGSVHHLHTIPIDFDRPTYVRARDAVGGSEEDIFKAYFDLQLEMLQALKPPIVGHFDLIRLHSDDPNRDLQQDPEVWSRIMHNLKFIASYNGIVEINLAAIRKGMNDPYPTREIAKAFQKLGGRFTLSDDAHSTDQVGLNYDKIFGYAEDVGIKNIHYLRQRTDPSQEPAADSITTEELKTFFPL